MERDLKKIASNHFDVVVIGGGIYGACTAWEAASRGLSVALLEKKDFASATSANSLKIIHGGFRYLQHADFKRMRASSLERRRLMHIAPHLVHPLPVLLPNYGHGVKGREIFALGLAVNHLVTLDRNRRSDPQKYIPAGRILQKQEVLNKLPGLSPRGLTGGIIFYDAQVYNSERLVLAFLHSAARMGAVAANYCEVTGLIQRAGAITGVRVIDRTSEDTFEVRAKMVINTAGPWIEQLLAQANQRGKIPGGLARAVNVVTRPIFEGQAVGLMGQNNLNDRDALVKKGGSFLFVAPWRGKSMLGTTYTPYRGDPDGLRPNRTDLCKLLEEFNQAYPATGLVEGDVSFVHVGLVPASNLDFQNGSVNLARHPHLHDHRKEGLSGLISVSGVKYTTARQVASEVIDLVFKAWDKQSPISPTATSSLHGGDIPRFEEYLQSVIEERPYGLSVESLHSLVHNYGSAYQEVLAEIDPGWKANGSDDEQVLLQAQVRHAIRDEMALKLSDIVLRRTELGTAERPQLDLLHAAASEMKAALGWSQEVEKSEIEEVNEIYNYTG